MNHVRKLSYFYFDETSINFPDNFAVHDSFTATNTGQNQMVISPLTTANSKFTSNVAPLNIADFAKKEQTEDLTLTLSQFLDTYIVKTLLHYIILLILF